MIWLSLLMSFAFAQNGTIKSVKYPHIVSFNGNVQIQTQLDKNPKRPKVKEVIRESAVLVTANRGRLEIAIDSDRILTLLPHTKVTIPNITWETGDVAEVFLNEGEINWQQTKKPSYDITLKSDLFEFEAPEGIYNLKYDSAKVVAEAKVFLGRLEFSAMNSENSVLLTAGQKVSFQGLKEDGEVAYDILLKGRKIPKGQLSSVGQVDPNEMKAYSKEEVERLRKQELKKIAAEKAKQDVLLPGQICRRPGGKLNQCAWTCRGIKGHVKGPCPTQKSGVTCVRQKCNANGEWSEDFVLDANAGRAKCLAQPQVGPCDY